MPLRKKANAASSSASKKSNQDQNSQPCKFGIQHFFERHSLSSQNPKDDNNRTSSPNAALPDAPQGPKPLITTTAPSSRTSDPDGAVLASSEAESKALNSSNASTLPQMLESGMNVGEIGSGDGLKWLETVGNGKSEVKNPKNGMNLGRVHQNNASDITPPESMLTEAAESPEVSKNVARKRFKFSPGMIIKQSQDDGGDEITWKISPVNERLQSISKNAPEVVKTLAEASRLNFLKFQRCSTDKTLSASEDSLVKLLSSQSFEVPEKFSVLSNGVSLKRITQGHDTSIHGRDEITLDVMNLAVLNSQSPFQTPPSLPYHNNKSTNSVVRDDGVPESLGLRQHKKALLELLDQVKDVISVEELAANRAELCSSKLDDGISIDQPIMAHSVVNKSAKDPQEDTKLASSDSFFLVLEVTEKCGSASSSGAQCSLKVLRLLNEQSGEEQFVQLWDEWFYSVVEPGDTILVIGEFDGNGKCDVNNGKNLIIVHPNILVSGTRVAGSLSCSRRAVLDERLKCNDRSTAALIGSLLHQIFQAGLLMEIPTRALLEEYSRIVVDKNIENLYACEVNEKDVYETLTEAIPRIVNWIKLFKHSQNSKAPTVDFGPDYGLRKVCISEVVDIEEMAWAPKYGLKGMIDASIRVRVHSDGKEAYEKIIPLEFKTGKGTNRQSAMEHSAQVILYTLIMSERYLENIDSGLLYYLHTDQTQGIVVRRSDVIGLIMRRNELARDIVKASIVQQLPPMLRAHGGSTDSSGLGDFFDSLTNHLTNSHLRFLKKWDQLIDLEAKEMQFNKSNIWQPPVSKIQQHSGCLSSIVLDASDQLQMQNPTKDNRFVYRFVRQDIHNLDEGIHDRDSQSARFSVEDDMDCKLQSGDYVVSFSKRLRLPKSTRSSMSTDLYQVVWRIDKDEFATSFAIMRFNLVQLFLQSAQSTHLRNMVVELKAPRFDSGCILSQDPALSYIWSERNLNDDQRRAIIKILTAKDYALILGMPGTGKTSTMVYAVKALLMRGASVLLTSYTNTAVDNLLIKLKAQGIDFVRIGRFEVVHKEVHTHCISAMDIHSVEEIKIRLDHVKVVAVTCLGITSPLLANKKFDVCIMDEAGQTSLPVSLGPLMFASVFVLVGDHYQLPPLVKSAEARENGMGISLFCRLSEAHPEAISALQSQYRMCAGIMDLSNALIYGDRLCCGSSDVENAKLQFSSSVAMPSWLKQVVNADKPVIFINTDMLAAFEANGIKAINNPVEAYIVSEVVRMLINLGIEKEEIGIITPYNSQANLIQHTVNMTSVEVHTIDKYQGRDKDCILVSFARSSCNPRNFSASLLGDWHRINVALTRAKKKLIMVGSCKTLARVPLLNLLIQKVDEQSGIVPVTRDDIHHNGELKRCSQVR
ncbi:hypothetical protein Nepgr_023469 [Nepenthes gracilis]|uniref:DNA replication ATP-dependent helicase/nuclease n=1 Tax=Nepenthes gracilis TaxID=150966 RepID=A0AAD3XXR2_NEPGR|nr:hypothetical protein Nepgr_023469 [Nepenthes gracilis]